MTQTLLVLGALVLLQGCQAPTSGASVDGLEPPDVGAPAPEFPHAPTSAQGWVAVVDCPMVTLPAPHPSSNECGQSYWDRQISTVRAMSEPSGGAGGFLRVGFPSLRTAGASYGGFAPASFALTGSLPENGGSLYVGQYMRWSANWWHPANEGHKTIYLGTADPNSQHFFAWVDNLSTEPGRLLFKFGTQWGASMAGNPYFDAVWTDQSPAHAVRKGVWHVVEWLITPNSPGAANGRLQAWIDGTPVLDAGNVPFFRPDAVHRWTGLWFSPIFASPGVMPPEDQYLDLAHLKVMVR
jgi:hypothetical protein